MATESYGRCDDGVHWMIYHELPLGQWWWMIRPDGGERVDSPQRYPTEGQALAAVVAARAAVVACRALTETMESLRARAEAAEARAAQAEADARVLACQWRAVDDTEDLQFFGACWREAHPGRNESDLGRDPTMADLVAALRRALGGAA